jgi:hypothetical protein
MSSSGLPRTYSSSTTDLFTVPRLDILKTLVFVSPAISLCTACYPICITPYAILHRLARYSQDSTSSTKPLALFGVVVFRSLAIRLLWAQALGGIVRIDSRSIPFVQNLYFLSSLSRLHSPNFSTPKFPSLSSQNHSGPERSQALPPNTRNRSEKNF